MSRWNILTVLVLLFLAMLATPVFAERSPIQSYVDNLHPGWNLGNTLDTTGTETSWGNPLTTRELIDQIADAGFKSIRIPVTWGHRMGPGPNYVVRAEFMDRVEQIVQWSLDAGLYVMLNLHHEGSWMMNMEQDYDRVMAQFNALWTQISERFKDYPDTLMFEAINEPRFDSDWNRDTPRYFEMLRNLNLSFFQIVRNSGGLNDTRPVVLSTLTGSSAQARVNELAKTIAELDDPNIIATVHYYGYWPFSVNVAGETRFGTNSINDIRDSFDRVYNTFVANGIPVVIGEYGLLGFDKSVDTVQRGEILKFFEYVTYYGQYRDIALVLWDNGQHYDRRAFRWRDQALIDVIMATDARSSNAETDSVFLRKGAPIKDRSIRMNLNGNTLVTLRHGDEILQAGTDYEMTESTLTLKAGLLERLVGEEYGVSATLTSEFSAGVNWDFDVIVYDTPVLGSYDGTTVSFWIPTSFHGDRMATMTALYRTGGIAGPNNWTPYKEFNRDFRPRYDSNLIQLTNDFFRQVRDNAEVVLRFYFWSGEVVEYSITKAGMRAEGVSSTDN